MKLGIIGGTGLEKNIFKELKGDIKYISRHGSDHSISPSRVDYLGNVLKLRNCDLIISFTACGSLKEELSPGMFVIPDQFIDFTHNRFNTPNSNCVVHTSMAEPFDKKYSKILYDLMVVEKISANLGGTVITIEGPRFSTKAESKMFKLWGADIINMTTATECTLANEFKIPYVAVAMVTDYDCWKEWHESVTMEMVQKTMLENKDKALKLIKNFSQTF